METLYYLNNNRNEPFTIGDIEKGKLIFEDDLIWHDKLSDWTQAKYIPELDTLIKKRPPISRKVKFLRLIKLVVIKTIITYLIFSVLIGVLSGLTEKKDFNSFYSEIKKAFDKNEKERKKIRLQQIAYEQKNEKEKEEKIFIVKENLNNIQNEIKFNSVLWKSELNSDYPDLNLVNEYSKKHDELVLDFDYYENKLDEIYNCDLNNIQNISIDPHNLAPTFNAFAKYGQKSVTEKGVQIIRPVEYTKPVNEVYIERNDGTLWTRWCVYGDDINQNENLSYKNCHKFWFRPYYSIFDVANLSQEEQENTFLLLNNFVLSSLCSNLPLIIIFYIIFYYWEKRKILISKK